MKKQASNCETCANYVYDSEYDEYFCDCRLDEDEMARFLTSQTFDCPYYDYYDEYKTIVRCLCCNVGSGYAVFEHSV